MPASAQSLADVARAEEARRKSIKPGAKVYTNENLGGPLPTSALPHRPLARPRANAAKPADAKPEEQKAVDPTKTAEVLEGSCDGASTVDLAPKLLLDALQTQVNGMNAEYLSMDDPGHRAFCEARSSARPARCSACNRISRSRPRPRPISRKKRGKSGIPAGWVR